VQIHYIGLSNHYVITL